MIKHLATKSLTLRSLARAMSIVSKGTPPAAKVHSAFLYLK